MPVSSVAVTEGAGKYLHTWQRSVSSVNREEQYVQLGEPALPTYTVMATVSTATTDSHLMQIMAGASAYVRIKAITVRQLVGADAATTTALYIIRLSTAGTGGTSLTPMAFDTSDTASATAMTLPSSKGTETGGGATVVGAAITLSAAPATGSWEWAQSPGAKPIIIPAGTTNGICVKIGTGVATATAILVVTFTETAWL